MRVLQDPCFDEIAQLIEWDARKAGVFYVYEDQTRIATFYEAVEGFTGARSEPFETQHEAVAHALTHFPIPAKLISEWEGLSDE